tara:strand:+ start:229823 stop:232054 length:2232 start_codon:yes stop_codon:yes gene_type:complete
MNQDSFKEIEALFHELDGLNSIDRKHRLEELSSHDAEKAIKLRSMFASMTQAPGFLESDAIDQHVQMPIEIPVDGTTVLAGRYTIVECIGVGGSSTVFRAQATNPVRAVAIKILRLGLSSQRARDRFEVESKSLAKLTHPHIAHIYETGVFVQDGVRVPWIAMELIPQSRTVIDYIEIENLGKKQRMELFVRICEAIQAAHRDGVLHLDLNASNVLVDAHGYPKIIDFGLTGLVFSAHSKSTSFVGTRYSMAPEQTLFGSVPFDERTDVFALGLLLVELLTGHRLQAFVGQNDEAARQLIGFGKAREQVEQIDDIDEQYRMMIDRMLRVDPSDRFESVDELLAGLKQLKPPIKSDFTSKALFGVVAASIVVAGWFALQYEQRIEPPRSNTLTLPSEVVMNISSQNPRNDEYSERDSQVVDAISSALDSDQVIEPSQGAALHATLADRYRVSGEYDKSIEQYMFAIELLSEPSDENDKNWTLYSLADLLIFLGRATEAELYLSLIQRGGEIESTLLVNLGIAETRILILQNENERAAAQIRYTRGQLNAASQITQIDRFEPLMKMSGIFFELNEKAEGLELLEDARVIAIQAHGPQSVSGAFVDVAFANAMFDREVLATSAQPKERLLRAIETFKNADDQFHAMWAQRQLGNIYLAIGDNQHALQAFTQAWEGMSALLGDEHHETIVCFAHREIVLIALGTDAHEHVDTFESAMFSLSQLLGSEHPVVEGLWEIADRIAGFRAP